MKQTQVIKPTAIKYPVAYNGTKNNIPLNPTGSNLASITEGFPDMTMRKISDGGLPPKGQDFNGLFYLSTDQKAYFQDGGYITFDETVSNLIGGYPKGAILDYYNESTNYYTKVISLIDDNTNNFIINPSIINGSIWQYVDFGTGANKQLSNLAPKGEDRLHALKGYEDAGGLLTDAEGLADVTKYAHSTYCGDQASNASPLDPKKFIYPNGHKPNITNDGIASGFSSTNYITITNVSLSSSNDNIKFEFTTPATLSAQTIISFLGGSLTNYFIDITGGGNLNFRYYNGSSISYESLALPAVANTKYYIDITVNGSNITVKCNNETPINITDYNSRGTIDNIIIGQGATGSTVDLKQFKITVDGIPVFSGNQTGIDVIKPDDYTAPTASGEAFPTISADGIASGFSTTNYINTNYTIGQNPFKIVAPVYYLGSGQNVVCSFVGSGWTPLIKVYASTVRVNTTGTEVTLNSLPTDGTKCLITIYYNGTTYTYKLIKDDGTVLDTQVEISSNYPTGITNNLLIGVLADHKSSNPYSGAFDLNSFKIYVNGDLVYQPCLRIPYALSKTGSKIADSVYRDRVNDMYEQFGYAPYYTLNEGTNFTLPQGEIYGMMIGQQTPHIVKVYKNGANGYVIYSNKLCKQWGTIATNTATFTIPFMVDFADTNYVFIHEFSADSALEQSFNTKYGTKTTSSIDVFGSTSVTNLTQDWIAIGYVS